MDQSRHPWGDVSKSWYCYGNRIFYCRHTIVCNSDDGGTLKRTTEDIQVSKQAYRGPVNLSDILALKHLVLQRSKAVT